jgi:hypothetical protein
MKFVNESEHPAELFRGELGSGMMMTSLLVRVRHRISPDGQLYPLGEGDAIANVRRDREQDEYGTIEPDLPFPRTGTDVIVLADAQAHDGPVTRLEVGVEVGPYAEQLLVVGDRIWERGRGGDLEASPPLAFEQMPLTWAHAFGGSTKTEYGDMAWPENPLGKGYYLDQDAALGGPLPNVEDPANLVSNWDDRPKTVGIGPYPAEWMLRLCEVVEFGGQDGQVAIRPDRGMFDRAHPRLSGKPIRAGDAVRITNTAFAPTLRLVVPPCPVQMELRLDTQSWVRPLEIEEVLLDLRRGALDLTYRKICKYRFVAHQHRCTILQPVRKFSG